MWGLEREKLVADEAALKARIQQLEEDMAAQVANPPPHPDAAAPRSAAPRSAAPRRETLRGKAADALGGPV